MVHYGQMSGRDELEMMLDLVTTRGAACFGADDYGLGAGKRAGLVVFDAPTAGDAGRTMAARRWGISRGPAVAGTQPPRSTGRWDGGGGAVRVVVLGSRIPRILRR